MKKYSLGALVAAGLLVGGLTAGSASAADLGGNCCADLEERIAELEATTARKGNRKVSLTVSGWVTEQVMWWDDGNELATFTWRRRHHARQPRQVHRPGDDLSRLVCWLRAAARSRRERSLDASCGSETLSTGGVWRQRPAVVLVRQERHPRQAQRRQAVAGIATTRRSWLTARARSFRRTGWCSTTPRSSLMSME